MFNHIQFYIKNVDEVFVYINTRKCLYFPLSCTETQIWDFFYNSWSSVSKRRYSADLQTAVVQTSDDTDHRAYVCTEHGRRHAARTAAVQASPYVVVCTSHPQATLLRVKGFVTHQKTTGLNDGTFNPNLRGCFVATAVRWRDLGNIIVSGFLMLAWAAGVCYLCTGQLHPPESCITDLWVTRTSLSSGKGTQEQTYWGLNISLSIF